MNKSTEIRADISIDLTAEQVSIIQENLNKVFEGDGLLIGSFGQKGKRVYCTVKHVPTDLASEIIGVIKEFYKGETNA